MILIFAKQEVNRDYFNRLNDEVVVVKWNDFNIITHDGVIELYNKGVKLENVTTIFSYAPKAKAQVLETLQEVMNINVIPNPKAIRISSNKELTTILLNANGIKTPYSIHTNFLDREFCNSKLGDTYVIKPKIGSLGNNVEKITRNIIINNRINFIAQEFMTVPEDERYIVVNNKIVSYFNRKPKPGDFRTNLAVGGIPIPMELDSNTEEIVLKSCEIIGLDIAGVDVKRDENGIPYILELNPYPSLSCINGGKYDFFNDIIDYINDKNLK